MKVSNRNAPSIGIVRWALPTLLVYALPVVRNCGFCSNTTCTRNSHNHKSAIVGSVYRTFYYGYNILNRDERRSERLRKRQLAANVLQQPNLVVSTQVVNEVCKNLIKKAGFNEEQIREVIQGFEQGCELRSLNSYLYVDYDCISFADVIAILKGQYDLGWCRNDDDGYFYMVGSLVDIAKKYKIPDLINSINTSYALNKIVSETESQGLEWVLVESKQYTKDINSSELIQLLGKLKLVPQLLKLGASIEQITEVFGLNAESLHLA